MEASSRSSESLKPIYYIVLLSSLLGLIAFFVYGDQYSTEQRAVIRSLHDGDTFTVSSEDGMSFCYKFKKEGYRWPHFPLIYVYETTNGLTYVELDFSDTLEKMRCTPI